MGRGSVGRPWRVKGPEPVAADEPIVGLKYAAVVIDDEGEFRFQSTTSRSGHARCYDVEGRAVCQSGREHRAPSWRCTCGYYAMGDAATLRTAWERIGIDPDWAMLEVELTGRVIEHDRGWRGQRQTILAAVWDDRCSRCGQATATGFILPTRFGTAVRPVCRPCGRREWTSPADLAGRLGTEVRLASGVMGRPPPSDAGTRVWQRWWSIVIGAFVVVVAAAFASVWLAGGGRAAQAGLVRQVAPLVSVDDPPRTAAALAAVTRQGRKAVVYEQRAEPGGPAAVAAVAVIDPWGRSGARCRVILTPDQQPASWEVIESVASDETGCHRHVLDRSPTISVHQPAEEAGHG
jgi:hypothetical protein